MIYTFGTCVYCGKECHPMVWAHHECLISYQVKQSRILTKKINKLLSDNYQRANAIPEPYSKR